MTDEKTLLLKKDASNPCLESDEKTAIIKNNNDNVKEVPKNELNNTIVLGSKDEKKKNLDPYDKFMSNHEEKNFIQRDIDDKISNKTIVKTTPSKMNAKRMFSRDELSNFTERVDYSTLINKKKLTDAKTEINVPMDDYLKEIDEVHIGYIIDGKYELFELITKKSGEAAIYKCSVKGLSGVYVAKVYYPNIQPKENIMEKILSNLNSENVVKLNMIGFIMTSAGRRLYEIMPFYSRGNLEMRMPLSEEELTKKIIPSINEGLRAIHRINIIHRDLKPNNLFIEEVGSDDGIMENCKLRNNERIVIGDFGISSQIKDGATHRVTSASRTRGYGAPETIRENITTPKSDYFAFGVTLLTLLKGEYPYHDEIEMILKIKDGVYDFPPYISDRFKALLVGLLQYDRNNRYGYDEVKAWLEKKEVKSIQADRLNRMNVTIQNAYEYKFRKYYDLATLVEAMVQDWDFSIQHIENRFIDKYFRGASNDFDIILQDMERLRHIGAGNDKIFLMLIYSVLHPEGIIYHGLNFSSFTDMSDYILESKEVDIRVLDLINNRTLAFIITLINRYSNKNIDSTKIKGILEKVEKKAHEDKTLAYYLLGYVFNKDKKKIDLVKANVVSSNLATKITSLEDVYKAFKDAINKEEFANELLENPRFVAWLYYMGYSQNKGFMK